MSTPVKTADTILGYSLTHRLGAGGYGEVWAAEAPGGLEKAVKLVYGYHDESRAQRELKALNHIKQLRHPFLLSLERIEVADGQLVIVTELAEKCLKTRFEECTAEGLKGIPREELLKYLRDAAEALDFLGAEHGLQHLDIKPENLLILSGHVKVADFGLVKNLNECTQSLMGGLTPTFSAPELFEGKPTRTSDQYSLAIVYQEMLTGRRPFSGTTAADLATQHMHGRADVSLVPRGDQNVILRALSKKSEHRYPSCTEFIDELVVRKGQLRPRKDARGGWPNVQKRSSPDVTQIISNSKLPIVASSLEPRSMPRFDLDDKEARVHPTLFIGLGRTGSQVVRELRRKLFQRLGDYDDIPSMRVICVDADQDDITSLGVGSKDQSLTLNETLEIPLRSPDAYRRDTGLRLPWLSRRWLFNIPRSLKTEGVRALGRLAFADHSSAIHERLHKTLLEITDPDNLAKTAESVGLEAAEQPRVFIVASTGGGVGSGTVIDCAYAVRAALLQNGLPDDQVVGLLAYLGGRSSVERKLSAANTYALLRELSHFGKLGAFPGDESCELPEFQDGRPTFSHTYYVDLGCDLSDAQWAAELESLSEYLYLDAATRANAFFKHARAEDEGAEQETLSLRSLSLQRLDVEFQPTRQRIVYDVRKQLVLRWSGREGAPSDFNPRKFTETVSVELRVTAADCVHHVERMTSATVGADLGRLLLDSVVEALHDVHGGPAERARRIVSSVNESLQSPKARQGISAGTGFQVAMNTQIHRWVTDTLHQLKARLLELVNIPEHRVAAASVALHAFVTQINAVKLEVQESLKRYVKASELTLEQLSMPEVWTSTSTPEQVTQYVTLRHRSFFLQWTNRLIDELSRRLGDLSDEVEALSVDMLSLIRAERPVQDLRYAPTPKGQFEQGIARYLQGHIATLALEVEEILEKNQFDGNGSLSQLIGPHGLSKQEFNRMLTDAAEKAVLRAFAGLEIDQIIHESGTSEEALTQWVYQCLSIAKNGLIRCGGQSRLLMAVPASSTTELLSILVEKGFGESPTMVSATPGDVVFCLEARDVQTLNLALRLVDQCPESAELIPRVTSRNDIEWQSLTGLT